MSRSALEMRAICFEVQARLAYDVQHHPGVGVVVIVYEPDAVNSGTPSELAWGGTVPEQVNDVVKAVHSLTLTRLGRQN